MRNEIFLSYSHKDSAYKERLETHLDALRQHLDISIWSDTQIPVGSDWENQIQQHIDRTAVAILLISKDYLASSFIAKKELPPILAALAQNQIRILPVILSPCLFLQVEALARFQAVNSPQQPLCSLPEYEQDAVFVKVAQSAYSELRLRNQPASKAPAQGKPSPVPPSPPSPSPSPSARRAYTFPQKEVWYHSTIIAQRPQVPPQYRCYQLDKPIYDPSIFPLANGESHWIFYLANQYQDLHVGDSILFQLQKIDGIRYWNDIGNARNLYISALFRDTRR